MGMMGEALLERAKAMLREGATTRTVCEILRVSKGTLHKYARGLSLYHKISEARVWKGRRYYKNTKGYWRAGTLPKTYLHVDVYADAFGRPRKGYNVHHRDGDKDNNRTGNLQALSAAAHARHHYHKRGGIRVSAR